ncbi:hypothetical protein DFH06DRAFT_1244269 [Mycena polygramma]|nr:hypothetical protein DFH06DRAFT_1244269 [Mycena polygramma]
MKSWAFPPDTTQIPDDQYAPVEVIDLAQLHLDGESVPPSFDQANQADIIKRAFRALREVGFLAIKGHGLCGEEFYRQFDIGRILIEDVTEDEKRRLHAEISEGNLAGYKPTGYYKRPDGAADTLEHFDNYPSTLRASRFPDVGRPYVSDIRSFVKYNHDFLLRRVLAILSLGMGIPQDTLWDLHHRGSPSDDASLDTGDDDEIVWKHSKDQLRYAMYHPLSEEDRVKKKHLMVPAHTDFGSVSFLYSQPMAGLQVLCPDNIWRYIRHYPEHIIVNLGDSLEFLTGGLLKAVSHRGM